MNGHYRCPHLYGIQPNTREDASGKNIEEPASIHILEMVCLFGIQELEESIIHLKG